MGNRVLKTQQWIDRYKSINSKMKSILEDVQEHWSFEHLCDLIGNRSFGSVEISEEFLMPDSSISDVGILRHVFLEYFFPFMYRVYGSPLYSSGRKTYLLFGLCRDFYTVPNFDLLNIGEDHMDHLFPQYTLRIHREQPQFCDLQMRGQRAVPAYIENESLVTYSVEKTFRVLTRILLFILIRGRMVVYCETTHRIFCRKIVLSNALRITRTRRTLTICEWA